MKVWMFYAQTGALLDVIRAYTLMQARALFLSEHPAYKDHVADLDVKIA
jgi:hypothetical protein